MKRKKNYFDSSDIKNNNKKIILFFSIFIFCCVIFVIFFFTSKYKPQIINRNKYSVDELTILWDENRFEDLYKLSSTILEQKPIQKKALIYKGFSAYYLAISQTDTSVSLSYIDETINSLRVALISNKSKIKKQIQYMLAKAYYQKNKLSSYNYYGDLVIKYFREAVKNGYSADDIPEYLGLTYASLGMVGESIASFTEALSIRESDVLLNAIGEQYYKAKDLSHAKQYLFKVVNESNNELLVLKSRNILGNIYLDENSLYEAKKEFESILEIDFDNADAYYGLGLYYEKQGDLIKARSEWRKALQVQLNHPGALQKLSNS